MTGREEVHRLTQRLDATFARARGAAVGGEPELQSDLAKYLCVLVSGYVERCSAELVSEHSRRTGPRTFERFVDRHARRPQNLNAEKLKQFVGAFDPIWAESLGAYLVDERKAALDSVVALRHAIAHGQPAEVTLVRIQDYWNQVKKVIDKVANLCLPEPK